MFAAIAPYRKPDYFLGGSYAKPSVTKKLRINYYPFGSPMTGRTWAASGADKYGFGMNGQEKDDEIYGEGNATTAEYWEYDTRLGRRWNVDIAFKEKPWMSSYHAFSNKPITNIDPNGANDGWVEDKEGNVSFDKDAHSQEYATKNNLGTFLGETANLKTKDGVYKYGDQNGNLHSAAPLPEVTVTAQKQYKSTFGYAVFGEYYNSEPSGKYGPYTPDAVGGQITLSVNTFGSQSSISLGFYLDNYGVRGFATPSTGFGTHVLPGFGVGGSCFVADNNFSSAPDPDKDFAGTSVSGSLNAGPLNFSVSQSSDGAKPKLGYTTYSAGLNLSNNVSIETSIGHTFLIGFDLHDRKVKLNR